MARRWSNLMTFNEPDYCKNCSVEERTSKIEGRLDEMSNRFIHFEIEITGMRKENDNRFKWIIGIMISSWLSLLVLVLAV